MPLMHSNSRNVFKSVLQVTYVSSVLCCHTIQSKFAIIACDWIVLIIYLALISIWPLSYCCRLRHYSFAVRPSHISMCSIVLSRIKHSLLSINNVPSSPSMIPATIVIKAACFQLLQFLVISMFSISIFLSVIVRHEMFVTFDTSIIHVSIQFF